MPASPWIGSTRNAQVFGVMAARSASASPNGMMLESRCERTEAVAILLVGREADDRDGASVEVVGANDDFRFAFRNAFDLVSPLARGLHRGLHRFCAGVHGQRHVEAGEVVQFLAEKRQLIIAEGARGQRHPARLAR